MSAETFDVSNTLRFKVVGSTAIPGKMIHVSGIALCKRRIGIISYQYRLRRPWSGRRRIYVDIRITNIIFDRRRITLLIVIILTGRCRVQIVILTNLHLAEGFLNTIFIVFLGA